MSGLMDWLFGPGGEPSYGGEPGYGGFGDVAAALGLASWSDPLHGLGEVIQRPHQAGGTHGPGGGNLWQDDNAVDIGVPRGTRVYAVTDGVIGDRIGYLNSNDPRMQGQRLYLGTPNNEFYYAHLRDIVVRAGQRVREGQLLGYSGVANGVAHLHLAARRGNPMMLLEGR